MAEKILIDREKANDLAYYANFDDYKTVTTKHINTRRWEADYLLVIQRKSDGKLFGAEFLKGLTEMQERKPFEDFDEAEKGKILFKEYTTRERIVTEYVPVA